jgi:hypothetical protein
MATKKPTSSELNLFAAVIIENSDKSLDVYEGKKDSSVIKAIYSDGTATTLKISGAKFKVFIAAGLSKVKISKANSSNGANYSLRSTVPITESLINSLENKVDSILNTYGDAIVSALNKTQSSSDLKSYSYIAQTASDGTMTVWYGTGTGSALVDGQLVTTERFKNFINTSYSFTTSYTFDGGRVLKKKASYSGSLKDDLNDPNKYTTNNSTHLSSTGTGGGGGSFATTSTETTSSDPTVDTESDIDVYASDTITWNGQELSWDEFYQVIEEQNGDISMVQDVDDSTLETSLTGIFGLPYQFSKEVDAPMKDSNIGRKYSEKILSLAPVLFLTPGEPVFMQGYSWDEKLAAAGQFITALAAGDVDGTFDAITTEGRYYSFTSNFPEFKLYANAALRALAYYMGIADCTVPIPGKNKTCTLKNLDIKAWMSNDFVRNFGAQNVLPFFLDAETQISEDFSNDTSESIISSFENKFSSAAREIQYIMGSKDSGGLVSAMTDIVGNLGSSIGEAVGGLTDAFVGKTLLSDISNQLSTIVSGGRIIFPEIWSGSSYNKNYSISLKLRSPDPDPVSIYMNIYMPIVLLISMTAPRQLNMSQNAYESPFMVRATYKSIFTCDLGLITSLSINKGGEDKWNVMGQPVVADVQLNIKDMYSDAMPISKYWGLLKNTAQMDYLAMCAGVDLNLYEPDRLLNLASIIIDNGLTDFLDNKWAQVKRWANQKSAQFLGIFSDTRFLQ